MQSYKTTGKCMVYPAQQTTADLCQDSPLHGGSAVKLWAHFCLALLTSSSSSHEQRRHCSALNCRDNSRGRRMRLSPCSVVQGLAAWQGVAGNPHHSLQQWALLGILLLFSWVGVLWRRRVSADLHSTTNSPAPILLPSCHTPN